MKIEEEIRQPKFQSPHQKALINLIFTYNWLHNKQQEFFKPFGITPQQFNILRILKGQQPNSLSATEIKSRMLDKNSDISRLLDRLSAKNLIDKKSCPSDKRASDIFISTEGLNLLDKLSVHQKTMDQVLQLTPEEADSLSTCWIGVAGMTTGRQFFFQIQLTHLRVSSPIRKFTQLHVKIQATKFYKMLL